MINLLQLSSIAQSYRSVMSNSLWPHGSCTTWCFSEVVPWVVIWVYVIEMIGWFSSVQSLSHVWLFATPWTTARQASLSITNSQSPPKPMSIESVMPPSHLTLCHPLLLLPSIFPSIRVFSNESVFAWGGQSTGLSAVASVLPVNTQDWCPLGWTDWISLPSKGLSRVFSNTTVQKHPVLFSFKRLRRREVWG